MPEHLWCLVLAGGDGTRLASVTRAADGVVIPKQYCRLTGGRSLLEQTLDRADRLATRARTVTVVTRAHQRWWSRQLVGRPTDNVVVQDENRGTAAGLLIPILHILHRDPDAQIVVLPSDHHFGNEDVIHATLHRAIASSRAAPTELVVLGIRPEGPESGYGWIVPTHAVNGKAAPVDRFVEKPERDHAEALMASGALWSPFILVGMAKAFRDVAAAAVPELVRRIEDCVAAHRIDRHYPTCQLEDLDFSRDVLGRSAAHLRVMAVPHCGWSDVGTPDRLKACLRTLPEAARRRARQASLPGVRALV
ncbi:MAG: NTP transferase domain-containing protein [Myxococcales bacterium]|nr:NTP transferase domain-containing protein [Myxococcales bacterium]MCB9737104.1 NTP transferase domain-containing protein [Deltaproteobacteria bacterium]